MIDNRCEWCQGSGWATLVRPDGVGIWVPCLKCETDPYLRELAMRAREAVK